MHFGRTEDLSGIDLALPPDGVRTSRFLALSQEAPLQVYSGCPVWAVRAWLGSLYPKGTKPVDFLSVYSRHYTSVEVNSTFYQLLPSERLAAWRAQVAPGFRFCPKVYRGITEGLGAEGLPFLIERFAASVRAFGPSLGLLFAQLPESFGPSQWPLLQRFLHLWPDDLPLAVEFRHRAWFHRHALRDEAVNLLYRRGVATVITDTPGRRDALHLSLTQPRLLIRFQGHLLAPSDHDRLAAWAERLAHWSGHSLQEVYFLIHQPEEALIPPTADLFQAYWQRLKPGTAEH